MQPIRRLTLSEQTAAHLREGFRNGRWSGRLPGVWKLSKELGVSRDAVRAALRLLEDEGMVNHGGAGRSRDVSHDSSVIGRRLLRVGILLASPMEKDNAHTHELIFSIRQAIEALGHACFIAPKSSEQLHHRVERIRRYMTECRADAWIVYSASREVLEMVAANSFPAFALGGRAQGLPLAGSRADLSVPIRDCVDALVAGGHHCIVLISPSKWRHPNLNAPAQVFLERLRHHGISADAHYNLPDWDHDPAGLNALLKALFFATPPTALMVLEPECIGPVLVFLSERGLRVPDHVSVVSLLPDPMQSFYRPALAHFHWPIHPHVKQTVRWVNSLVRGEVDQKQHAVEPTFVPAESIGPCPKKRNSVSADA